jgi:Secretion system C-terminal sorting domain
MKAISKTGALLLLFAAPIVSFAQEKKEKVRIRIEQEVDGKTTISEKIINSSGLSSSQKDEMIEKFKDSVLALNKGKAQGVKIEIDNDSDAKIELNGGRRIERNYNYNNDNGNEEIVIKRGPKVRVYKKDGKGEIESFDSENFTHEFHGNMESLRDNMKQMGKDLKFEFRTIPDNIMMFDGGSSGSKTIKNVEVFPNNPKTEILNVRFNAPQKGDVGIKVLDVKGNVIAKEEIKDFSGDYVGQINIGKQKSGTIFVMITQGEDGNVKRVVLPSNEK